MHEQYLEDINKGWEGVQLWDGSTLYMIYNSEGMSSNNSPKEDVKVKMGNFWKTFCTLMSAMITCKQKTGTVY